MATVKHAIGEHDAVEFLDSVGRWPAGTAGAVVRDYGAVKLVEIADSQGKMLDLIQVREPRLKLVANPTRDHSRKVQPARRPVF